MKPAWLLQSFLCCIFFFSINPTVIAQHDKRPGTTQSLTELFNYKDSLLFNAVFTTCNIQQIELVFAPDFEYYQDKGDMKPASVTSRTEFIENIKKRCERNKGAHVKREIASLQVFPMNSNGALQTGVQRFYLVIPGHADQLVETSRFSRVWVLKNSDWKIERELDNIANTPANQNSVMKEEPVYKEIAHMDSVLFNAFNTRDFNTLKSLFSEDLEFYQDRTGFTGYAWNMENFKTHLEDSSLFTRRELVEGSLEVYLINNYGAIQIGVHRFYSRVNGQEKLDATAKFMALWQKRNGGWKITREFSYDHQ